MPAARKALGTAIGPTVSNAQLKRVLGADTANTNYSKNLAHVVLLIAVWDNSLNSHYE
jgi:hypothetical protein